MIGLMMLAATFTAPQAIDMTRWVKARDYPAAAAQNAAQASQRVAILVDPEGKPAACEPLMQQNAGNFVGSVCDTIMQRSRFNPAVENGRPTWGVWTTAINFIMPDQTSPNAIAYDIVVPVNRLPGKGDPQGVRIEQLVDAQGKVEACTITEASTYDALNRLACSVATVLPIAHAKDRAGAPVRSVVRQTVLFAVDKDVAKRP
jgi:hypothetical protein